MGANTHTAWGINVYPTSVAEPGNDGIITGFQDNGS